MATLTADRHLVQPSLLDPHEKAPVLRRPQRKPTLDDLVSGTWTALVHTHSAACLVCGTDLTPRFSSGPHPVAAKCRNCGSELS
jgi:hypothetical protein